MLRADDVARYFLTHQDPDNEPITNMKLQKLCYYAQGIALVVFGAPLFHDDLEHWQHGPVVPNVFHRYKTHAQHPIPAPRNLDLELYDAPTRKLLDNVHRTYGKESASQLRNTTHDEPPWKNTPDGAPIPFTELTAHFESLPNIYEDFGQIDRETLKAFAQNPHVKKDLKRGIAAMKAGQMVPWDEMKDRLGIR